MLFKRNINHKEYIFVQFLPIRGQCIVLMFWFCILFSFWVGSGFMPFLFLRKFTKHDIIHTFYFVLYLTLQHFSVEKLVK